MQFLSSLYCWHELDRKMQPSWWVRHNRKLNNELPAMCWWFDSASTESGFQCTLRRFAAAYDTAGIQISSVKTDMLHVSRNTNQCLLQLNGATQKQVYKFKYLGVAFTSDGRQNKELDIPIGKSIAIMKALHYSVVKRGFSCSKTKIVKNEAKLSIFETVFVRSYLLYLGMVVKIR